MYTHPESASNFKYNNNNNNDAKVGKDNIVIAADDSFLLDV